ncbi:recombinase family protein [Amphritea sp. HPY]|uniref:recombinase family protein n=1 Tax=Amphritea sp. HPY TaxID=3421652 RepID=UPI003D7D5FBF
MKVYGYARVSTEDQDLTIQREALLAAGCDVVREEKVSGQASTDDRKELSTLLEFLRKGDCLVVTRIDRLARSVKHLQDIVHQLKEKGVSLRATEQQVDTSTAAGKAFFDMLGVFAEFETNLRKERQAEGIAKAKLKGVYKGRKPTAQEKSDEVLQLIGEGLKRQEVADQLGIGIASVYRILKSNKPATV